MEGGSLEPSQFVLLQEMGSRTKREEGQELSDNMTSVWSHLVPWGEREILLFMLSGRLANNCVRCSGPSWEM